MSDNIAIIQDRYLGPQEDSSAVSRIFENLRQNNQSVVDAAMAGNEELSRDILNGRVEQSILLLAQKVDAIHTFARGMSQNLLKRAKEKERDVQRQVLLAIILGGTIMAFAGFILNSSITRPLYRLRSYMAILIEGDTKKKIPEQHRQDEIGDMARALEVFRNVLENREQVEKARHDAEERAHLAESNRLKDQQAATAAAMALLEKRVEDHTRDLAESNKALIAEIEQRKEIERALKNALRDVELSSAAKSNFLAHMSHELRTPLNAILGFTELLKTKNKSEDSTAIIHEYADHIGTAGHNLLEMVNTILTLTNEGAKNLKTQADRNFVNVQDLIDAAMTAHAEEAKAKSIEIEADLAEPQSQVLIDKEMLIKALANLLSNAIKFSPQSAPVMISGRPAQQHYILQIIDQGIGIAPDKIHSIMEPFSQTENPLIRGYQGTGLGLPHARQMIENNDGSIVVESNPGEGTIVTISLPLAPNS
ncbi:MULTISPECIES: ATP-binding protein [unclassified Iodidimonas]|uniref:HAMP domain-containing sensor histidine kinase n=1 Tax=unclassified Iodidimonas TaxID=2626145 RepID=UPI0024826FCD|nr:MULTISPECIES: ATP-binding protein [unclassified Iodidimonas]